MDIDSDPNVENAASGTPACSSCQSELVDSYYLLAGAAPLCPACAPQVHEAVQATGNAMVGLIKAALFGLGAAIVGALVWWGVAKATGYELGLIAIGMGWLVGKGVHSGSGGRGGWFWIILALALTWLSIALGRMPSVVQELQGTWEGGQAGLIITSAFLSFAYPAFQAMEMDVIGLIILAIAFWEAGKANRKVDLTITGPHPVPSQPVDVTAGSTPVDPAALEFDAPEDEHPRAL